MSKNINTLLSVLDKPHLYTIFSSLHIRELSRCRTFSECLERSFLLKMASSVSPYNNHTLCTQNEWKGDFTVSGFKYIWTGSAVNISQWKLWDYTGCLWLVNIFRHMTLKDSLFITLDRAGFFYGGTMLAKDAPWICQTYCLRPLKISVNQSAYSFRFFNGLGSLILQCKNIC